ncbi:hypothetical protein IQ254_25180 [Nodosilinea sp. LEGE 07088]|uniref:hypothetical protein n=1 Tax=Nodosilinea sp. LEGE 07088 TaxID=2777968 RepID=UPI00187DF5CD|nr:hypothetical protein [Nodosilinea sp. LEGE 07088]MBE9140454.1 hypothetical protein [Nodosilinea sp. LEGE 07088]
MNLSPALAASLFMPATMGLLVQVVTPHPWPHRLLALSLMLMSLEQAHMARVDLRQGDLVALRSPDRRLAQFRRVVTLTVLGQVAGFSVAAWGYLGWGMGLILLSLIGFNLAATIRLDPETVPPVQAAGWRSRLAVLSLDAIALLLAVLWIAQRGEAWVAGGMFAITLLYGGSKLATYARALGRPTSAIHIAHAAQQHPQTSQQN